jgi:AcrR family transcriptional regulator
MTEKTPGMKSGDTATLLLNIAEILFSEYGYVETTVRQIAHKAKVNQALISYHFQSKRGLYNAVFERRATILLNERVELLETARKRANDKAVPLREILFAFIYPPLRMAGEDRGGRSFVKLQARLHNEPKEIEQELRARLYDKVSLKFAEQLRKTLPHLSPSSISWRMIFIMGLYQYVLLDTGRLEVISNGKSKGKDLEAALPEILDFCEHGFLAPSTPPLPR